MPEKTRGVETSQKEQAEAALIDRGRSIVIGNRSGIDNKTRMTTSRRCAPAKAADLTTQRKADHEAFLQRQARREAKFQAFLEREERPHNAICYHYGTRS